MAITTRKNASTKAIQSAMAKAKKHDNNALIEWEIACNTNNERGHVYDQTELHSLYSNSPYEGACGATKITHLHNHNGNAFQYIVIKRFRRDGHIFYGEGTGNQMIDEIACWVKFAEKEESDMLCPILKYFTSKSDKVGATSKTMRNNVVIIAQKAVYVDDMRGACEEAERLNKSHGFNGETYAERKAKLMGLARKMDWRDVEYNPGNSGVIFDYAKGCYKAVFIDYAL